MTTETLEFINTIARDVNKGLHKVLNLWRYPGVEFLSQESVFQPDDIIQRRMLSRDGLHLSFWGTDILANRIEIKIHRVMAKFKTRTPAFPFESNMYPAEDDRHCKTVDKHPHSTPKTNMGPIETNQNYKQIDSSPTLTNTT